MTFKSILDANFKYRNAASTDLAKTFERIRREQRQVAPANQSQSAERPGAKVVATIGRARRSVQSTR
jgi:hypothetical protein